jgi:hypothetical protein
VDALPPALNDHAGMITLLADLLFHQPPTAEETATLTTFLGTLPLSDLGGNIVLQKRRKIGALAHVMMTMPMFQLK